MDYRPYAGIGSRETPDQIIEFMEYVATVVADNGLTLRSGHAPGADQAFERGAGKNAEIYLPWNGFERDVPINSEILLNNNVFLPTLQAAEHAAEFHPAWDSLRTGVRRLMARNSQIILGEDLKSPVRCVICWTPSANLVGGTAQGIRIAQANSIRVYNLARHSDFSLIKGYVERQIAMDISEVG